MPEVAHTPMSERNCSWARALDMFGDKWSMLIIREALAGTSRFSEFQRNTGAAKNILSSRLEDLCGHGIFERVPQKEGSSRVSYVLTAKGQELFVFFVALGQWGDRWIFGGTGEPARVVDRVTGAPVQQVAVFAHDGKHVLAKDVALVPGPGASEDTNVRLNRLNAQDNA